MHPVRSRGFSCDESIAVDGEQSRLVLTTRTLEGVDWRSNFDVKKAGLFQHSLPACTRQSTGNSTRPKIDILDRGFGHGFAVRHISELKPSTPTQNTVDFGECCLLVGAKIDDAIADNHVCPSIIDW